MKKILWIVIPVIIVVLVIPFLLTDNTGEYRQKAEEEIETRKRYLMHNETSPFVQYDIPYKEPQYFSYDPEYRVEARVNRVESREVIMVGTSDGEGERYLKFAYLNFTLKGLPLRLLVLKPVGMGSADILYLAFADETSGESTYGGGRYLDVEIGKSDKTVLDFNLSYNPYCAYAPKYSCPLPPRENIVPVAIKAGEKDYKSSK